MPTIRLFTLDTNIFKSVFKLLRQTDNIPVPLYVNYERTVCFQFPTECARRACAKVRARRAAQRLRRALTRDCKE